MRALFPAPLRPHGGLSQLPGPDESVPHTFRQASSSCFHPHLMRVPASSWLLLAGLCASCAPTVPPSSLGSQRPAVLVFYKTRGFHHASIPAGLAAFQQLGRENNLRVDTTQQATRFVADTLRRYAAVVFLNTTGDVLDSTQQVAFEHYIGQGHGFMGVHAASDTEYNWPWYGKLVGAYFQSHPKVQLATVRVVDARHPATSFLPAHGRVVQFSGDSAGHAGTRHGGRNHLRGGPQWPAASFCLVPRVWRGARLLHDGRPHGRELRRSAVSAPLAGRLAVCDRPLSR